MSGLRVWTVCAVILASALTLVVPARADELTGAVAGQMLIGFEQRYGALAVVDVWAPLGLFRIGGATGIGALSDNDEASSRVFTPVALSLALMPERTRSGPFGVVRAGGYGGAEKAGFIGGVVVTGTAGYGFALGEEATLRVALDFLALIGVKPGSDGRSDDHGGVFVGPSLGFGF